MLFGLEVEAAAMYAPVISQLKCHNPLDGPANTGLKHKGSRIPPLFGLHCVIHRLSVSRQPLSVAIDGVVLPGPELDVSDLVPPFVFFLSSHLSPPASFTWLIIFISWLSSCS